MGFDLAAVLMGRFVFDHYVDIHQEMNYCVFTRYIRVLYRPIFLEQRRVLRISMQMERSIYGIRCALGQSSDGDNTVTIRGSSR